MQTSTMSYNAGPVDEVFCFHLSLEKVYVTGSNSSLILFQTSLLYHGAIMLLVNFTRWCSLLILLERSCFLRADDESKPNFNIRRKLEERYKELENIHEKVQEYTDLYAPDDKRLEGLEVMTDYLIDECDEASIQLDDGRDCLNAVISVVQNMPDFNVSTLSCDEVHPNCSRVSGNETKNRIEEFRKTFLNGVGRCNYSITRGKRESLEARCMKEQSAGTPTESNVEECLPDTLFWQGLEHWSSNLTSMLLRLKADSHNELGTACKERILLQKEKERRKRKKKKQRKKERRQKKKERKSRKKAKRSRRKQRKQRKAEREERKKERKAKQERRSRATSEADD